MERNEFIIDIETNGLNPSKIHCLCYYNTTTNEEKSIIDYTEMKEFLLQDNLTLICHNVIRYDAPVLERILNIKIEARLIDTLGLSWYLYPTRHEHGLESWGVDVGIAKPKILDWENQSLEEYINRCTEDVRINTLIYSKMTQYLSRVYSNDIDNIDRIINYLMYKMDCAKEQEEVRWRVDVERCIRVLGELEIKEQEKVEAIRKVMPEVVKYKTVKRPEEMFTKSGKLSKKASDWYAALDLLHLPPDYDDTQINIVASREPGKPAHQQLKKWLFSLGWKPRTFKHVKNKKTLENKSIPQISLIDGSGICPSVKELYDKAPGLENLEGLYIIQHRIGILKGFLRDKDENNFIQAQVQGFTNTLRFMHTTVVNLPAIYKPYGKDIRGSLIAPDENHVLCGSDMSSLEDNTKQHYMYFYDPEYVQQMRVPGFSPHLDIGVQGKMVTQEESDFYVWLDSKEQEDKLVEELYYPKIAPEFLAMTEEEQKARFKLISKTRKDAKQVNFSAVYGVGAPKMSLTTGWPESKSKELLEVYWKRNWSVKRIARDTIHKTVDGQMWLYNPVSGFWYTLRYEKDKFSTLNQGTGVYCFDMWVRNVRQSGIKICGQFHDEIVAPVKIEEQVEVRKKLEDAIQKVNDDLKLNIQLGISIQFGNTYADIH